MAQTPFGTLMYHIEFQVKQKKQKNGVTENISMSGAVSTSFQTSRRNNKDYIRSPRTEALQPLSILAGQNAVYFYLRSFLSSSEKAKWVVVDSFFTTSKPKIVLAAYSGVLVQGVKRRVTGRGPGTRAERWELSYGEEQRVPRPSSLIHYLFVCLYMCVCVSFCLLMFCESLCEYTHLHSGELLVLLAEMRDRLTGVRKAFNSCLSASAVALQIISLLHSNQAVGSGGEKKKKKRKNITAV